MPNENKGGLRLYSLPAAPVACPKQFFKQASTDVRAAKVRDASDVLTILLEGAHNGIAGRLAEAFKNTGCDRIADQFISTMKSARYAVLETDPSVRVVLGKFFPKIPSS
jgi:hypothetical protein